MAESVCVIGSGPAGLVTTRLLLDAGLDVCVYERAEQVGGVWILRTPDSDMPPTAMYTGLCTNLPGAFMAFSDHPFPIRTQLFPTQQQVLTYLGSYAERFGLHKHIQFQSEVVDAQWKAAERLWSITIRHSDGTSARRDFGKLVVCSGHYNSPIRPQFAGANEFPGDVTHAFDFYDLDKYQGKSVLVIGSNASAGDIATMLVKRAPGCTVHMSARSTPTTVGRAQVGPALKLGVHLHGGVRHLTHRGTAILAAPAKEWGVLRHGDMEVQVDTVLCATGYLYKFPFLRSSGVEEQLCGDGTSMRHMYRRVFYSHNPSLALIGTPNTLIPPWIVFEEQARWLSHVWSGRAALPCGKEMEQEASARHVQQPAQGDARDNLGTKTPAYCNELATLTGSEGYYSVLLRSKSWRMIASRVLGRDASTLARL